MIPVEAIKAIPASVWDQLGVVLVFVFTLGTIGYWLVRKFTEAIAEINSHYGKIVTDINNSWQRYFDARMEATALINQETITKLAELSKAVRELRKDFDSHDQWERQVVQDQPERQLPRTGRSR